MGGGEVGDVSAKLLHRCGRLNLHRKWSRSFAKTLDLVHFSPEVRAIRNTQHFANGRVPLLCTFGLSEPAPRFYLADQVQTVGEIELAQIIVRNQPFLCLTYNSEAAEFARKHADLRRKIIASTESLVLMRVSVGAQRCLNRAILVSQSNFHIRTIWQLTRGAMAAAQRFARLPEIVGLHWFQYYDHPNGGREAARTIIWDWLISLAVPMSGSSRPSVGSILVSLTSISGDLILPCAIGRARGGFLMQPWMHKIAPY